MTKCDLCGAYVSNSLDHMQHRAVHFRGEGHDLTKSRPESTDIGFTYTEADSFEEVWERVNSLAAARMGRIKKEIKKQGGRIDQSMDLTGEHHADLAWALMLAVYSLRDAYDIEPANFGDILMAAQEGAQERPPLDDMPFQSAYNPMEGVERPYRGPPVSRQPGCPYCGQAMRNMTTLKLHAQECQMRPDGV